MIYAFLLIVCPAYSNSTPCLPAQSYATLETCKRVGDTYRKTARGTDVMNTRCVQVPRKDIL